jgi:hypothetical protein
MPAEIERHLGALPEPVDDGQDLVLNELGPLVRDCQQLPTRKCRG